MHSKILNYLLTPALEFCEQHIVTIDGAEYVPVENFAELLGEMTYFLADVMNQVSFIVRLEVASCFLLLIVAFFLFKVLYYRHKKKSADQ